MTTIPLQPILALALFIFLCGLTGLILRRNLIFMLMSIELMLNAANLVFVVASRVQNQWDGQIMVFFIITVAACEAAIGLAMIIALFRKYGHLDTDRLSILKG